MKEWRLNETFLCTRLFLIKELLYKAIVFIQSLSHEQYILEFVLPTEENALDPPSD